MNEDFGATPSTRRGARTRISRFPDGSARWTLLAATVGFALGELEAWPNPVGGQVVAGSATITSTGPNLQVQVSGRAVLQWGSFNIAPGETTTFVQPSPTSIVWNQINSADPSQIFGNLNANGFVVLQNQAGFFFGPNASVKAAGFLATTAPAPADFSLSGSAWSLGSPPPHVPIVNYGAIRTTDGGAIFLIADEVENRGDLVAPGGIIGLYAGKEVSVSTRPDGLGLTAHVTLPAGSVDNHGRVVADAGTIALCAQVVNQGGLVQANSVREQNGVIELVASDSINLEAGSSLQAQGDASGASPGGNITLKSGGQFTDQPGSQINVAGGVQGGNGGQVELSASQMSAIHSAVSGQAVTGWKDGGLTIDPDNITLVGSGSGTVGSGTIGVGDAPSQLTLNVSAFSSFSQITLQARNTISVNTLWDLGAAIQPNSTLTLEAGQNILVADQAGIRGGQGWSVTMVAGTDFVDPTKAVPGQGSIQLSGSGFLETADGSIHLTAGQDITVGSGVTTGGGAIRTIGGGSIDVQALAGTVNCGKLRNGYVFSTVGDGYTPNAQLGGISTAAGGDVTITAGKDIVSYLPTSSTGLDSDGGSGAFGPQPGNVTLQAGGSIYGHYVVANGQGTMTADQNAGSISQQIALSLVKGDWAVTANNIYLQEVRNPNGIFNGQGGASAPTKHLFDYDPAASVTLIGLQSVELLGAALPRNRNESSIPSLYPPSLSITAGAGGLLLGNNVTLFPSPVGNLSVTTTGGGGFASTVSGNTHNLVMSDSGSSRYDTAPGTLAGQFGINDHASVPVHLNDPNPVRLNISGTVQDITVGAPKATVFKVGGDLINSSFVGQNLAPTDVTLLQVAGQIWNRNSWTFEPLTTAPNFALLQQIYPSISGLLSFSYSAVTQRLAYDGRMSQDVLNALLNPQVYVIDPLTQQPMTDPITGLIITQPTSAQFAPADVLRALYAASQNVPASSAGYQIGGPGKLVIQAQSLDLGVTAGVRSLGPGANPALAAISARGADIQITLTGDLTLFSSAIASESSGNIQVQAGGGVLVGSTEVSESSSVPHGIYSSGGGNVSVVAQKDIEISGSRIAAYNGGNVTVRSETGNIDAGTGGLGYVRVDEVVVDPVSGQTSILTQPIPGSGILATSFPGSDRSPGNILVETPQGNINANSGGIVQTSLSGVYDSSASVTLRAGTATTDAQGNKVTLYIGNILAGNSGVIGGNVVLDATGDITGLAFARQDITITTPQNVSVTALAQGNATVEGVGKISGTIIGIGSVTAKGSSVDASILSQNVTGTSSGQVGFGTVTVASGTATASVQKDDSAKQAADAAKAAADEEERRRRAAARPVLTRTIGRVTVILPKT
jgi:filamentous hemagglutinin family protein